MKRAVWSTTLVDADREKNSLVNGQSRRLLFFSVSSAFHHALKRMDYSSKFSKNYSTILAVVQETVRGWVTLLLSNILDRIELKSLPGEY